MIYDIRHVTTYHYASNVTFAQCTLTLTPIDGGGQKVEHASLSIEPKPSLLTKHRAFFGHQVYVAQIDVPHRELRIDARARVFVHRSQLARPDQDTAWETVRDDLAKSRSLASAAPTHFMFPSSRIRFDAGVTNYAGSSFTPGRPIAEAGRELMTRIRSEFRYAPDATRVSTPLVEAFEKRHGVCQDFAHIMIAGLRGLGLSARYVSGFIRTIPPPGKPRLEGADATHAWVDIWCGPEQGWVGLDPTNAILAGDDHIVLATGRDYADVAPVGGILLGASDQDIDVNVDVIPIQEKPGPAGKTPPPPGAWDGSETQNGRPEPAADANQADDQYGA